MGLERREGYWLWTDGPVPRGASGITIGNLVIVRQGTPSPRLLRHELVHVRQFKRMGVLPFLASYTWQYLRGRSRGYSHRGAYRRISHEVEAYWLERTKAAAPPSSPDHGAGNSQTQH